MSAIKLSTPSSGSISLSPADTASNLTITVPAVTGTMLTTASTGTVLQVVNTTNTTAYSTTSSSFVSTGITASITPTSSSSKILVLFSCAVSNNTINGSIDLSVYRGGSEVGRCQAWYAASSAGSAGGIVQVFDSPATTSSVTYTIYLRTNGTGTGFIRPDGASQNVLTLMEIAA
jgi:hypothetical protein